MKEFIKEMSVAAVGMTALLLLLCDSESLAALALSKVAGGVLLYLACILLNRLGDKEEAL